MPPLRATDEFLRDASASALVSSLHVWRASGEAPPEATYYWNRPVGMNLCLRTCTGAGAPALAGPAG